MLALSALASGFLSPIATLIATALQLQLLRSYIERLEDVLQAPPEQDKRRISRAPELTGAIELDHVSFSYGPLTAGGVHQVSVHIAPGQKVAIVGRSGRGNPHSPKSCWVYINHLLGVCSTMVLISRA